MNYIDRYAHNNTTTRYRFQYFWQDGKRVKRWTSVEIFDRATGKSIRKRKAGSAVPQHVKLC